MNSPLHKISKNSFDFVLYGLVFALVFFGLVMIYDASVVSAFRDFGDKLYYFKNQLIWASLGIMSMFIFSYVDYHRILKYAPTFVLVSIVFLTLVLIPHIGAKVYGARRWINVGSFTFQPSEFAKLALIFYQTYIMSKFQNHKISLFDIVYVLFIPAFALTGLVLLEPDMGTALVFIGIILTSYFVGGGEVLHFALMIPPVVLAGLIAVATHPYRIARLKAFMDPNYDPQGASYQINQILISIGNGGFLGVGVGGSRGKFDFIPEIHSDAIFSVIAEELGFVGAVVFIGLVVFLLSRFIKIARGAKDYQGRLLASGIIGLIAVQAFLNLASIVALVPLTGIPLPFISYGGSSLLLTLTSIGILQNIKKQS